MGKVPRKNISSEIADVVLPSHRNGREGKQENSGKRREEKPSPEPTSAKKSLLRISPGINSGRFGEKDFSSSGKPPLGKIIFVFIVLLFLVGGFFALNFYQTRAKILNSLAKNSSKLEAIGISVNSSSSSPDFQINDFWQFLKNAGKTYGSIGKFSSASFALINDVSVLENNGLDLFLNNRGGELIADLGKIKDDLSAVGQASAEINSGGFSSGLLPFSSDPLAFQSEINRFQSFLDALTNWLKSPDEKKILVLFQNPSEMRPTGGFWGSYAIVSVKGGSLEKVEVHDINDAAQGLKIIPPKPLQALVTNWRPADSNWFFDFPTSAKEIQSLAGENFNGAVAVSPKVFGDILSLTGPVEISEGKKTLTLNQDNFLTELQKEVELKQTAQATYPKEILKELAPFVLQKISSFDDTQKQQLVSLAGDWFNQKDLMVYFSDKGLENFVDYYEAGGSVFNLPQNFNGDYLAVVNANIGGGKSDLFVKQKVVLESQLNADGTADDILTITRQHAGNKSSDWWYRLPNYDYLQVFVPPSAEISNFSGGWNRQIYPKVNYAKAGYQADPAVQKIEDTAKNYFAYPALRGFEESGKKVFASWVKTLLGRTSKVSFYYKTRLFSPPAAGMNYQFVFEKQAGFPIAASGSSSTTAESDYVFQIAAPVGYRWKENNLPVFEYETSAPSSRLVFNLILEKVE